MSIAERTYEQIALEEPDRKWELHRGRLREKPVTSFGHNRVQRRLGRSLTLQLDPDEFELSIDASRVRQSEQNVYIPDLFVLPVGYMDAYLDRPRALEVYEAPLPLVVEVWSPSTGEYDVESKLPEYTARGDREISRVHPFERTLTAWRNRPDGSFEETGYRSGVVDPVAPPGGAIDLDALFA